MMKEHDHPPAIPFTLDGDQFDALPGETLLQAARRHGREIPHLCYQEGMRPDGNCRACVVEIEGERTLTPSCCREVTEGMVVNSNSGRSLRAQKMVLELLRSDMADTRYRRDSELDHWSASLGVNRARFPVRRQPAADSSHPAISVNLDACIQCTRCLSHRYHLTDH